MYKYYAVPVHHYDVTPEEGTHVICLVKNKLWAGEIVKIDFGCGWAVKDSNGKLKFPYLSDVFKPGAEFKSIKSIITINNHEK